MISNPYLFGTHHGRLPEEEVERRRAIAAEHEVEYYYAEMPGGPRSWFAGPNLGEPFNGQLRAAVLADVGAR